MLRGEGYKRWEIRKWRVRGIRIEERVRHLGPIYDARGWEGGGDGGDDG